jgi:hypothetical protein
VAHSRCWRERDWLRALPALLGAEPDDQLLAFLRQAYVRRAPHPDRWRSALRGRLSAWGVPDPLTADRVMDALL